MEARSSLLLSFEVACRSRAREVRLADTASVVFDFKAVKTTSLNGDDNGS